MSFEMSSKKSKHDDRKMNANIETIETKEQEDDNNVITSDRQAIIERPQNEQVCIYDLIVHLNFLSLDFIVKTYTHIVLGFSLTNMKGYQRRIDVRHEDNASKPVNTIHRSESLTFIFTFSIIP